MTRLDRGGCDRGKRNARESLPHRLRAFDPVTLAPGPPALPAGPDAPCATEKRRPQETMTFTT